MTVEVSKSIWSIKLFNRWNLSLSESIYQGEDADEAIKALKEDAIIPAQEKEKNARN